MKLELEQYEELVRSRAFQLPDNPKPCIVGMLNHPERIRVGARNMVTFAIATELRRTGRSETAAVSLLLNFRDSLPTSPGNPFTDVEVRGCARSAYKSRKNGFYSFGCDPTKFLYAESGFCVGHESCIYYQQVLRDNSKKKTDKATLARQTVEHLTELGWLPHLSGNAVKLYSALIVLERQRGFAPGSLLCVRYEQLSTPSGLPQHRSLKQAAEELRELGLVTFTPGTARGHASEFKRLLPIRVPPPKTQAADR